MPVGKPRTFTPQQFELAWQQYFQWCDDNPWYKTELVKGGIMAGSMVQVPTSRPYTEVGFCAFHDLGINYVKQLSASLTDREDDISLQYSSVLNHARAKCYAQKFEGAAVGAFNANIIARDLGLTEKIEQNVKQSIKIKTDLSKLTIEELKALRDINNKLKGE